VLSGKDTIIHSKTGTGKTVCFAFPMLQKLAMDPFGIFGLIITPSRELAIQISQQFALFGVSINLRCTLLIGGLNQLDQVNELKRIPHIIVATPGRLRYILEDYP
jgi:ATP-dependent RNA helicase DDX49/DBP8